MPGSTSLTTLLSSLVPTLTPTIFVFATLPLPPTTPIPPALIAASIMTFREREGTTLILPEETAQHHNLPYIYRSRQIILDVHSSLEAVGFMAAVSTRLAMAGISVNPVSAYFHDHLFVKVEDAEGVMDVLGEMRGEAEEGGGGRGGEE